MRGGNQKVSAAAGRINYPGDVWIFEWSGTPVQPSSESQYRRGMDDLRRYNERLAQGKAYAQMLLDHPVPIPADLAL